MFLFNNFLGSSRKNYFFGISSSPERAAGTCPLRALPPVDQNIRLSRILWVPLWSSSRLQDTCRRCRLAEGGDGLSWQLAANRMVSGSKYIVTVRDRSSELKLRRIGPVPARNRAIPALGPQLLPVLRRTYRTWPASRRRAGTRQRSASSTPECRAQPADARSRKTRAGDGAPMELRGMLWQERT